MKGMRNASSNMDIDKGSRRSVLQPRKNINRGVRAMALGRKRNGPTEGQKTSF